MVDVADLVDPELVLVNEYLFLIELMAFQDGEPDADSLANVLREAWATLSEENYIRLQHDVRLLKRVGWEVPR
jgi:hypothetical protein